MPFETDTKFAANVGPMFGDYFGTFISEHGQVRADLFRCGERLVAYLSFPTGLGADAVTDRYVSDLYSYAQEHGFEDRIRLILT
jgi:hypothetical protein